MAITGRTLGEAAAKFRDHANSVLHRTITHSSLQLVQVRFGFSLSFRQDGRAIPVALATRVGRMGLYLGQTCDSVVEGAHHRLRTMRYAYGLIPDSSDTATIRWEYVRSPAAGADWCRHHVQGPIEIVLNRAETTLNGLHVPTGYVPFEEIIRFCIVDLEVPSISEDWRAVLHDSYEQFRRDFVQA